MRNNIKYITGVLFFILLLSGPAFGAFNQLDYSARSVGMGNVFVAVADDSSALFANPSGIGNMKSWEVQLSYNKLVIGTGADIGENYLGVVYPMKNYGSLGFSWYTFGDTVYSETVYQLAYAYSALNSSFGVNVKYLSNAFAANDWTNINPYFSSLSKNVFSFGVSFCSRFFNDFTVGFFMDDFNSPDIGLSTEERLPVTLKGGVSYRQKDTLVAIEIISRANLTKFQVGGEINGFKAGDLGLMSFRLGAGFGDGSYFNICAGTGLKFNIPLVGAGCSFDYGFMLPTAFADGTAGTHKFTLTFTELYNLKDDKLNPEGGLK